MIKYAHVAPSLDVLDENTTFNVPRHFVLHNATDRAAVDSMFRAFTGSDTPNVSSSLSGSALIFKLLSMKQISGVVRPQDAAFEYTSTRRRPVSGCIVHRRLALVVFHTTFRTTPQ